MAEHTPGPWHYRPRTDDDWGTVRASPTEEDIREGFGGWLVANARSGQMDCERVLDEHRRNKTDPYGANARLIAAAPDMLNALLASRLYVETLEKHLDPTIDPAASTIREHAAMVRGAIAKATGGKA